MYSGGWCCWRCAMSAALVILPVVWAMAPASVRTAEELPEDVEQRRTAPEVAFYRKYTEGLLRRYVRLSMEAGRAAALCGRGVLFGHVADYPLQGLAYGGIFFDVLVLHSK